MQEEEIENFLNDDSIPIGVESFVFNMEEDILFLESLLSEDPSPIPPMNPNQTKSSIKEPGHSFSIGYEHFSTTLVTNEVAESSTNNLVPILHESEVTLDNGSESIEPVKDDSSIFTTFLNLLLDDDEINFDKLELHVESNFVESTSNHDTVKIDNLDEFSGPLIPIHIAEEERIRREHDDYINRIEMLFTINPHPHPSGVENDDSDGEVNAIDDLRVDNSISNSKHESSESEDSDFDNPSVPIPPPKLPEEELDFEIDFGDEISVVRNTIVEFEYLNLRDKLDDDDFSIAKVFSFISAKSKDTIFDPGKDCAKIAKNQSKTGQYQHKNRSQQQKPNEQACKSTRRSYFPITTNVTIPRRRSRKQTSNIVEPEIRTIVEMADNRTMAQMLQAPIEGYEDAIVVPSINANNFELKQTLINLVQTNQFIGRQDPHNHLRFFNKVTSTFRHPEVPNTTIKEDLVSKFINQFFPPSKTTYLRNEITNFLPKPNETFNEARERFKDFLRQCPHYSFSELHQLDTFYNALNPNDQDALDSAVGGNFLDKIPRECLSIIKKDKLDIHMNRFKKSLNDMKASFVTPTASIKAVEEQFQTAAVGNFIQGNRHQNVSNQMCPPGFNQPNQQNHAKSSTKNLVPILHKSEVTSDNGSESIDPVKDDSLVFMTFSNPLFDDDEINSDKLESHVESNFVESTSNHDTVKNDNLNDFSGPLIPIHIAEEERIRREHADYINRMEMLFTINPQPHPPENANTNVDTDYVLPLGIKNDDSDGEVDAVDDLCVDNSISNSEHESSESEDSDFDNPSVPQPPPEPPDEELDF
nr:hypothetical protein [Tanacetum cinerariifolium]